MPIIDIEVVGLKKRPKLVHELASACARALDSRPSGTWVRLRRLAPEDYAENGPEQEPTFVEVLLSVWPESAGLAQLALRLSEAVAGVLGRPLDSIHVLFAPEGRGRVAFGGQLLS